MIRNYAEIENNTVERVLVFEATNSESGAKKLAEIFGGTWLECNRKIDGKMMRNIKASIGDEYHPEADVFVQANIYPSWTLNKETWEYEAPYPSPGENYFWNEDKLEWTKVPE